MWRSLFFLIAGCNAAARAFSEDRAEAVCAWHARCDTLEDAGFTDQDECLSRLLDSVEALDKGGELDCPGFDQEKADACVAAWTQAECTTVPDLSVCDQVCD